MIPNIAPPGLCLEDVRTFLAAGGGPQPATDALLSTHGLDPASPGGEIVPLDLCFRIFADNVALVKDETHAVFQERMRPGSANLIIARMLHCETLSDALEAYAEASSVVAPALNVSIRRQSGGVAVRWLTAEPGGELYQIVLEGTVAVYYAVFAWLVGGPPRVLRVRAPARRRTSPSTLLNIMGAPVQFSGEHVEVLFATDAAEMRVQPREVTGWQDGVCREITRLMRHAGAGPQRAYADEVRAALLDGVDQQAVAAQWGVSLKTVARRLEQEGCSFRRVRDEVRMQRSATLMRAGLTVEAIGEAVGYEDERSFRRAFRRWFGVSPSTYRLQQVAA